MNLFLSYCHEDEADVDTFHAHAANLKKKWSAVIWYDRKMLAGEHIETAIETAIQSADIFVFFVTAKFLDSKACQKEVDAALALKKSGKAEIVPVIVSPCDWENSPLRKFLACPTDGKPVKNWSLSDSAWKSIIKSLDKLLLDMSIRQREFTENFQKLLDDPGNFISSDQDNVPTLRHLYAHPVLTLVSHPDKDNDIIRQESAEFLENLDGGLPRTPVLILGDELSGKTVLCRTLCRQYRDAGCVPVYVDGSKLSNDNLAQMEKAAFKKQYRHLSSEHINDDKKIILFDNFAGENLEKQDLLSLLSQMNKRSYRAVVLTADAANARFISVEWEKISIDHQITTYRIKSAGYKTRAKIVDNWVNSTRKADDQETRERLMDFYQGHIDTMYKGNSIPPHPFYILTMLENIAGASALSQPDVRADKTSYGHCYTALVTHALLRAGVQPSKIDEFFNVLTELAYHLYQQDKNEIDESEFLAFIKKYEDQYMEAPHMVLDTLLNSGALSRDLIGMRMQEYMFYYFTARYLSQNFVNESAKERCKGEIETIMSDAHRKRNGNILLFLVHHMPRSRYLLDKLNDELDTLLAEIPEATLDSAETEPLDEFLRDFPKIAIDSSASESGIKTARKHHVDKTGTQEIVENRLHEEAEEADKTDGRELVLISKSFRMMSIAGSLLKNQYGTMEKSLLAALAMRLRGLTFRIVRAVHMGIVENPEFIMSFVRNMMSKHRHWKRIPANEQERAVKLLVGALALGSAYTLIDRCALSIGSEKLVALVNEIGKEEGESSPAHQLLQLAASLWYGKNLHIKSSLLKDIESLNEQWQSNPLAARLLREIVANHLHMRRVDHKTRSHLAHSLGLDVKGQLIGHQRHKT